LRLAPAIRAACYPYANATGGDSTERTIAMHLAIFSDTTKSHFPDEWTEQSALILFGNAKFDLTRQPMDTYARLNVFSIFGAAKVIVPAGTRVVTDGVALFGAASVRGESTVGPEVRIRYLALFGNVEVVEAKSEPVPIGTGRVFPY
jgi:hypothetical protein